MRQVALDHYLDLANASDYWNLTLFASFPTHIAFGSSIEKEVWGGSSFVGSILVHTGNIYRGLRLPESTQFENKLSKVQICILNGLYLVIVKRFVIAT